VSEPRSVDDESYESDFVVDSDVESQSEEVPCGARLGYEIRLR